MGIEISRWLTAARGEEDVVIFHRSLYLLGFILYFCYPSQAQVWQLANPAEGAPGFVRGFGENIYVGGENQPSLRLTRSGIASKPTTILSDANYPGRSFKYFPLIALANDGSALVFWVNRGENRWKAHQIGADGAPQGNEITLANITTQGSWLNDLNWDVSSNGESIVFVWQAAGDIRYQLLDFSGMPLSAVRQANQDTTVIDSLIGEWHPGAAHPSVYMRDDASFIIAWQDERSAEMRFDYDIFVLAGDVGEVYARRFDHAGEPIGDNFLVNQDSIPRTQTYPAVCMDDAGTLFCYWLERDTSMVTYEQDVVRGRIIGDSFARDLRVSGNQAAYRRPSVTASTSGFAALWQQNDSLLAQAFGADGDPLWQPRNVIRSQAAEFAVRTLDGDSYSLVWSRYSSPDIQACLLKAAAGTLGEAQVIATEKSYGAKVGIANRGLALAYPSNGNTAVNVALLNADLQPRHQIERLNTDLGGARHEQPDGVQLKNGNYLAVWSDGRRGVTSVYGQIFNSDGQKTGVNLPLYLPAEHSNHQTPSLAAHPVAGAVLAYRSQTNRGAKQGAWLQRISSDGSLIGPPVRVDRDTGAFIWNVKVAVSPTQPFTVMATWSEGDRVLGRLFDGDLSPLSEPRELARTEGEFNLYADNNSHFWLMVRDYATKNLYLSGFDSNLLQFPGPTQLNDATTIVNASLPRMAFLANGKLVRMSTFPGGKRKMDKRKIRRLAKTHSGVFNFRERKMLHPWFLI